jgi:hypothetical protein
MNQLLGEHWFENGNITDTKNKHMITGKILRILVEQLLIHPFFAIWQGQWVLL